MEGLMGFSGFTHLFCCLCFEPLTPDTCAIDNDRQKWDVCWPCALWDRPDEFTVRV